MLNASTERDLDAAFATMAQLRAGRCSSPRPVLLQPARSSSRWRRYAIPASYEQREFAVGGGLMSYGTILTDAYRQVGIYTGKILNGDRPADLPVFGLTRFEFVINLKTAKTLGLTIPPGVLAIVDEVIE